MRVSPQTIIEALGSGASVPFDVVLPGGEQRRSGEGTPRFTIVFRTDSALFASFARGHIGLLEAYFDQAVDVQGDFGAAMAAGMDAGLGTGFHPLLHVENHLHEL